MANVRIKDLSTDSALSAGDYVVVDSASEGSRKFDLGTELADLKKDLSGWSDDTKTALLNCFAHVAWTDEHGQDYYDALYDALYAEEPPTPTTLESISCVYTQSGTVYDTDSVDSLESDLVVTAHYSDTTSEIIASGYTLSGSLTAGTSTITVAYSGKTTTFSVTVTELPYNLNLLFSDITLSDGYIGDDGTIVTADGNKYLDKNIPAIGFWIIKSDGSLYINNNLYYRLAEYDSNADFLGRSSLQVNATSIPPILGTHTPNTIKMGFNSATNVLSNADRFIACNLLDTDLCDIANSSIDTSGNVVSNTGSSVSDFLPIGSGYIIAQNSSAFDSSLVVFYDESKALISRNACTNALSNNRLIIAVPNNAEYVRFRCNDNPSGVQYISYRKG